MVLVLGGGEAGDLGCSLMAAVGEDTLFGHRGLLQFLMLFIAVSNQHVSHVLGIEGLGGDLENGCRDAVL